MAKRSDSLRSMGLVLRAAVLRFKRWRPKSERLLDRVEFVGSLRIESPGDSARMFDCPEARIR
jgi:hypothetical protein